MLRHGTTVHVRPVRPADGVAIREFLAAVRCDVAAIEDVLLRVSAMVDTHPDIVELDCNPLIVTPGRAVIVDARIRVEASQPGADAVAADLVAAPVGGSTRQSTSRWSSAYRTSSERDPRRSFCWM